MRSVLGRSAIVSAALIALSWLLPAQAGALPSSDPPSAPSVLSVSASPSTVYPRIDGYRDSVLLLHRAAVRTSRTTVTVRDAAGRAVRRLSAGSRPAGTFALRWDGRDSRGRLVAAGAYRASSESVAGSRTLRASVRVVVSHRVVRTVSGALTVQPRPTVQATSSGGCSLVATHGDARTGWVGSIGLYSDFDGCGTYDGEADAARSVHRVVIPRPAGLLRWGRIALAGSGDVAPWQTEGRIRAQVLDADGRPMGDLQDLDAVGPWSVAVPVDAVLADGALHWALSADDGTWYDLRTITVSWTARVLR